MRFILIDRICEIEKGTKASGIKNLAMSEDYFEHHFPFFPLMPGVLILEAMVELSRWLILYSSDFQTYGILQRVDRLKLREPAHPGDTLLVSVEWQGGNAEIPRFTGRVTLLGKPIAEAQFENRLIPVPDGDWQRRLRQGYRMAATRLNDHWGGNP